MVALTKQHPGKEKSTQGISAEDDLWGKSNKMVQVATEEVCQVINSYIFPNEKVEKSITEKRNMSKKE